MAPTPPSDFIAGRATPPPHVRLRRRSEAIAHAGLYTVCGTRRVRVTLGDQAAHWHVVALAFSGRQFAHRRARIRAVPAEFIELDVPSRMGAGDLCEGRVYFRLRRPAKLRLRGCGVRLSEEVAGTGCRSLPLSAAGELRGALLRDGRVLDAVARPIAPAGLVTRRVSHFAPLAAGRRYEGEPVMVYPSAAPLVAALVRELGTRAPERSEEAGARLGALGWLLRHLESASAEGAGDVRLERVRGRIVEELGALAGFRAGALFSRWPGQRPGQSAATAEVLRLAWPLFEHGFPELDEAVRSALAALHDLGWRDNRLARYDAAFVDPARLQQPARLGPEEITALQSAGVGEARLWRATLVAQARSAGPQARWRSELAWSASGIEPTCHAVLALLAAGATPPAGAGGPADWAARGLRFIFQRLDPAALAPTDALACIELLVKLGGGAGPRLKLDGRAERPLRPTVARSVEVLEGGAVFLRRDRRVTEDPYVRPGAQRLWARLAPGILRPGQRTTLSVLGWPRGLKSPVLRIHLPGHLSALQAGTFGQVVQRPLRAERVQLDLLAIRRGRGALRIMVYDQHDPEQVAVHDGLRVLVS